MLEQLTDEQKRTLDHRLGYSVLNRELLEQALTHASFSHARAQDASFHYDRLEFLGDAVLGLVLAEKVFRLSPAADSGALSQGRARLARRAPLAAAAKRLGLGDFVRLSDGEQCLGGRLRSRLLAEVYEAIVGALFLDGGLEIACAFVDRTLIQPARSGDAPVLDFKSALQEKVQSEGTAPPEYRLVKSTGPPHRPQFLVEVEVEGKVIGWGAGGSKREAEQSAAQKALKTLSDRQEG